MKTPRVPGRFRTETPAGSRAVVRIRIVVPVPVELRPVVPLAETSDVLAVLGMDRSLCLPRLIRITTASFFKKVAVEFHSGSYPRKHGKECLVGIAHLRIAYTDAELWRRLFQGFRGSNFLQSWIHDPTLNREYNKNPK